MLAGALQHLGARASSPPSKRVQNWRFRHSRVLRKTRFTRLNREMRRLDSALARFSAALDTLERATQARLGAEDQLPAAQKLIAELKADKDRLETELLILMEEHEKLEGVNNEVAGRLDTAIRDIRSVLAAEAAE